MLLLCFAILHGGRGTALPLIPLSDFPRPAQYQVVKNIGAPALSGPYGNLVDKAGKSGHDK